MIQSDKVFTPMPFQLSFLMKCLSFCGCPLSVGMLSSVGCLHVMEINPENIIDNQIINK